MPKAQISFSGRQSEWYGTARRDRSSRDLTLTRSACLRKSFRPPGCLTHRPISQVAWSPWIAAGMSCWRRRGLACGAAQNFGRRVSASHAPLPLPYRAVRKAGCRPYRNPGKRGETPPTPSVKASWRARAAGSPQPSPNGGLRALVGPRSPFGTGSADRTTPNTPAIHTRRIATRASRLGLITVLRSRYYAERDQITVARHSDH